MSRMSRDPAERESDGAMVLLNVPTKTHDAKYSSFRVFGSTFNAYYRSVALPLCGIAAHRGRYCLLTLT